MKIETKSISLESWNDLMEDDKFEKIYLNSYMIFNFGFDNDDYEDLIKEISNLSKFITDKENHSKEWIMIKYDESSFFIIEKSKYEEIKDILNLSLI